MTTTTREEALAFHKMNGKPGKLEIRATKPLSTQRDLSLAYSPGVAEPVLDIAENPDFAYEYTAKGNLVAVISNGTAILGLGNLGALASKPVMEGKAVLFKRFADIDVFDLEVNETDPDEFVRVVSKLFETFGGINLEDIKAPECFYIEEELQKLADIPVFHDDQHGTAIIASAGLLNGLHLIDKKITDIKLVISGAGAAAISCAKLAMGLGVRQENIVLVDSRGVIYQGRTAGMNQYKAQFALDTQMRTLEDAVKDADVFYGLSIADVLTPEMVKSMARDPLIFAMANPDPEIKYDLAKEVRPDSIVATGRSDYPNQINNVLGFPYIFRGALDVRARTINDEMKLAAALALADLAREDVPETVLRAYELDQLSFGRDYIIPTPFDPRVLLWVAPAVAKAAMESGVARQDINLDEYREQLALRQNTGEKIRRVIVNKARSAPAPKRIVFPEGEETAIIRAAAVLEHDRIAHPILIGDPGEIHSKIKSLGIDFSPEICSPRSFEKMEQYALEYHKIRQRRGMILNETRAELKRSQRVLGIMMVKMGDADGYVGGLTYEYPFILRPALRILGTHANVNRVCAANIMLIGKQVYLFADTSVTVDPSPEDLAEIAILTADFARKLGLDPRVALVSSSNFGSVKGQQSEKMGEAVKLIRQRAPNLAVDGEMQVDTALMPELSDRLYPFSQVRRANVLVFPSLDAANIACKLLTQLSENTKTIGPVLLGMGAPCHILDRTDQVDDIVHAAAVVAMDAVLRE